MTEHHAPSAGPNTMSVQGHWLRWASLPDGKQASCRVCANLTTTQFSFAYPDSYAPTKPAPLCFDCAVNRLITDALGVLRL